MTTGIAPVPAAGRDRRALLLGSIDVQAADGLEIGPSLNPVVPKASGARVRSVDHTGAAALRAKYADHVGVDVSKIEEVDFVWAGGRLRAAIGESAVFDYVVASHVLEHLPNPIAFLQDCAALLRPGGRLALALPDHRFCFDHARPLTTFGAWVDAYDADRQLHTPGTVVDHLLHAVARNGAIMWTAAERAPATLVHGYPEAVSALDQARAQAGYLDVHAWVLNPSSFALLIENARRFGLVELDVLELVDTVDGEFFVALGRSSSPGASAPPADDDRRLALMLAARETERAPVGPAPQALTLARRARRLLGRSARRLGLRR